MCQLLNKLIVPTTKRSKFVATKILGTNSRSLTTKFGSRNMAALFVTHLVLRCEATILLFVICARIENKLIVPTINQSECLATKILGTTSRSLTANFGHKTWQHFLLPCDALFAAARHYYFIFLRFSPVRK